MTTDCSWNYKFNTWKFQAQTWGEHVVCRNCLTIRKIFVHNMFSPYIAKRRASDKDLPVIRYIFLLTRFPFLRISANDGSISWWSRAMKRVLTTMHKVTKRSTNGSKMMKDKYWNEIKTLFNINNTNINYYHYYYYYYY